MSEYYQNWFNEKANEGIRGLKGKLKNKNTIIQKQVTRVLINNEFNKTWKPN